MKILHATKTLHHSAGGLPAVAIHLAIAARATGNACTIVSEAYSESHDPAAEYQLAQVGRILVKPFSRSNRFMSEQEKETLAVAISNSDIVHLHGVWDMLLLKVALAAKKLGVPYVISPHGMLDNWSLSQSWFKKWIARMTSHRYFLKNASAFHALNQAELDSWLRLGLKGRKFIVPNGVDLNQISALNIPEGCLDYAKRIVGDRKYILFLGRLHFKKGLDILCDAFRKVAGQVSDLDLVIVGPDDGVLTNLRSRVSDAGLQDRVHFLGALVGPQKFEILRNATVFCLPSRQEGFSVAVLEALACGTPVVISGACNFPEVVGAGVGVVTELSAEDVAAQLVEILTDDILRDNMRSKCVGFVSDNYTWANLSEKMLQNYRTLC